MENRAIDRLYLCADDLGELAGWCALLAKQDGQTKYLALGVIKPDRVRLPETDAIQAGFDYVVQTLPASDRSWEVFIMTDQDGAVLDEDVGAAYPLAYWNYILADTGDPDWLTCYETLKQFRRDMEATRIFWP